jgi:hypothetical protein
VSNDLTFGGAEAVMTRDKGTANSVQGFVSSETVVSKNITALATSFVFSVYEYISFSLTSAVNTVVWIKVAGVWKQTAGVFIKVAGTWKNATTFVKESGTWK